MIWLAAVRPFEKGQKVDILTYTPRDSWNQEHLSITILPLSYVHLSAFLPFQLPRLTFGFISWTPYLWLGYHPSLPNSLRVDSYTRKHSHLCSPQRIGYPRIYAPSYFTPHQYPWRYNVGLSIFFSVGLRQSHHFCLYILWRAVAPLRMLGFCGDSPRHTCSSLHAPPIKLPLRLYYKCKRGHPPWGVLLENLFIYVCVIVCPSRLLQAFNMHMDVTLQQVLSYHRPRLVWVQYKFCDLLAHFASYPVS